MDERRVCAAAAAIILIGLVRAAPVAAETLCPQPWCRKAEALLQHWLGERPARSGDVIAPSADIDPQMALEPPGPQGVLRIIRPQASPERQQ
ncbi:MAG TPA: hypothetical protein VME41_18525 [Stellaceae bacterium]|nr:hypothetical protein [Stellaceae bacterium]